MVPLTLEKRAYAPNSSSEHSSSCLSVSARSHLLRSPLRRQVLSSPTPSHFQKIRRTTTIIVRDDLYTLLLSRTLNHVAATANADATAAAPGISLPTVSGCLRRQQSIHVRQLSICLILSHSLLPADLFLALGHAPDDFTGSIVR
jgi:hypothetical protein